VPPATAKKKTATRRKKRERPDTVGKLSVLQTRVLRDELAGEMTHAEIRAAHNVPKSTWQRWHDPIKCPHYAGELERGRGEMFSEAAETARSQIRRILRWRSSALEVLAEMSADTVLEPRDRIRAAAELARACVSALLASGFVPPQPPVTGDGGANREVAAELQQIRAAIEAQGLRATVESLPAQPTDAEIGHDGALERAQRRIAELEAKLAAAGC